MTNFLEIESANTLQDRSVCFRDIRDGEVFWRSGLFYVKATGVITDVAYPSARVYTVASYNVFNLTHRKVGCFKGDTVVRRVLIEPIKARILE